LVPLPGKYRTIKLVPFTPILHGEDHMNEKCLTPVVILRRDRACPVSSTTNHIRTKYTCLYNNKNDHRINHEYFCLPTTNQDKPGYTICIFNGPSNQCLTNSRIGTASHLHVYQTGITAAMQLTLLPFARLIVNTILEELSTQRSNSRRQANMQMNAG